MSRYAIIGGSGLDHLAALAITRRHALTTAYGSPSSVLLEGRFGNTEVLFLPRHGADHTIPPHRINYRANIAALRTIGVTDIIAVTAVGGISDAAAPCSIVIPDQVIDYTSGREHTFFDGMGGQLDHVDFTEPFSENIRQKLIAAAAALGLPVVAHGVYGATQGPRLESTAEIKRLARDGCTIVGMTGMPEAALAREAGLGYANCSLVVNWAAGLGTGPITLAEIMRNLEGGMHEVLRLIAAALSRN